MKQQAFAFDMEPVALAPAKAAAPATPAADDLVVLPELLEGATSDVEPQCFISEEGLDEIFGPREGGQ